MDNFNRLLSDCEDLSYKLDHAELKMEFSKYFDLINIFEYLKERLKKLEYLCSLSQRFVYQNFWTLWPNLEIQTENLLPEDISTLEELQTLSITF